MQAGNVTNINSRKPSMNYNPLEAMIDIIFLSLFNFFVTT
jgi:hypothetical protein